ncbi:molybdopterin-dependent oxidoreductase [Thalassococcus sp. S3]|uniref:molybdopterin-dependent oxidoreductase n=1 Tax=Thalassococcus sp. S3 TaxID=2017482 RepID=UPI0010242BD6|nr:molybdopterin-dependent oxidoreductase [Thalassococcus sp. S3]QBF32462.1 Asp-tRNA(Asn)/Glu-tRNA(Gln) amidotransferase GatCAB subunit C [Thalassococcus sp. S3]
MTEHQKQALTANHWGVGVAQVADGRIVSVAPHPDDPSPSRINDNIAGSLGGRARVLRPAVRAAWLDHGPTARAGERGRDPFVEVSWDDALDLVAAEMRRVRETHGNESLFSGSYGWSSAGRFHHAQGQLKRFLNTQGGFVRSEGNYSYNAALVLMPHIVGPFRSHVAQATRWSVIAEHTDLVVMFGGIAKRNTQVSDGGVARHRMSDNLQACAKAGVRFVNISPLRSDAEASLQAEWLPPRPGSDTAIMMGLAYVLLTEGLCDRGFLDKYTVGFDKVASYLRGESDGLPKTPEWAAAQSGLEASRLRQLAREMAAGRTMISTAAGVQRADWGEQPLWMTVTLAAMLGQIGLPGGGYTIGYGVNANIGNVERPFRWGSLPQGTNPVETVIPVAMISDLLLRPGEAYAYNGSTFRFPDIRMVWWAGGNPFHHHQDLNRLRQAFQRPETIIVNEVNWTATARHADIVLPVAAAEERMDIGGGKSDNALVPMPVLAQPPGEARIEYDIYSDLAARLGSLGAFTEGKSSEDWIRDIWSQTQAAARAAHLDLPDFDSFLDGDVVHLTDPSPDQVFLQAYRADPLRNPLPTPSGRIELFSETIAGFDLPDCKGHATWMAPRDAAGEGDLYLLSGQPKTRLHSQLDNGAYSLSHKIAGREPVLLHPEDAQARGIRDGDVVELFNARGRCLAGARVTDEIRQGCAFLWTGAWYDPDFELPDHLDRHGNPNVLTHDLRTSSLSQSPAAHSARIHLRRWDGTAPPVQAHDPPAFRNQASSDSLDCQPTEQRHHD